MHLAHTIFIFSTCSSHIAWFILVKYLDTKITQWAVALSGGIPSLLIPKGDVYDGQTVAEDKECLCTWSCWCYTFLEWTHNEKCPSYERTFPASPSPLISLHETSSWLPVWGLMFNWRLKREHHDSLPMITLFRMPGSLSVMFLQMTYVLRNDDSI